MGKKKINKLCETLKWPTFWNWLKEWENAKKAICTILWLVAAPILMYYGLHIDGDVTHFGWCGFGALAAFVLVLFLMRDRNGDQRFYVWLSVISLLILFFAGTYRHELQSLCQFADYEDFLASVVCGVMASVGMLVVIFIEYVRDHLWWL